MFYGMRFFSKNFDYSVSFSASGVGYGRRRGFTSYASYSRVLTGRIIFEGEEFLTVKFIPRKPWWIPASEFGFRSVTDLDPLLELIESQGLAVHHGAT